jgi:hypothetical protein
MFTKLIVSAGLVSSVAAWAMPYAHPEPVVHRMLNARQAASTAAATPDASCSVPPAVLSIVKSLPTPPVDLESAIASVTNYCVSPSFTGTVQAEWTSYENAVLSWVSANSAALLSYESEVATACPALTAAGNALPVCSTGATAASSTAHQGAAAQPRATMMAAAGGIVAGMIGVLAL